MAEITKRVMANERVKSRELVQREAEDWTEMLARDGLTFDRVIGKADHEWSCHNMSEIRKFAIRMALELDMQVDAAEKAIKNLIGRGLICAVKEQTDA